MVKSTDNPPPPRHPFRKPLPGNERSLADSLQAYLQHSGLERKLVFQRLKAHWNDWAGEKVASATARIELSGASLRIYLLNSALRQEIALRKSRLREHLNQKLGENFLQDIELH